MNIGIMKMRNIWYDWKWKFGIFVILVRSLIFELFELIFMVYIVII